MRGRLRNLDTKISFFAFADVITAVSGMLVFITLILATDLEQPLAGDSASPADLKIEQQLQETLRQQLDADSQNRRLQELLAAVETAPAVEKLEADIARLRTELSQAQQKQAAILAQLSGSKAAILARDNALGLTDLKASIQRITEENDTLVKAEAQARGEMARLEQQVARVQSQLLKVRQREGQLWLIPDKNASTKEPILVIVAGSGIILERFDHPEQRKSFDKYNAGSDFENYLQAAKKLDQYVVFLVRPSGIDLFQDLLNTARKLNFEVGYDALEEGRQIHFSTPPSLDETTAPTDTTVAASNQNGTTNRSQSVPVTNATPRQTVNNASNTMPAEAPPAQKTDSWWQRFRKAIGL
ncbi:MAG: hypothetical protein WCO56_11230 [Verrucomicrobiota bacterium]